LVGRKHPLIGASLGIIALLVVVAFIFGGRVLGLSPDVEIKTEHFRAPIEQAQSAKLEIVLSDSPVILQALPESIDLIDAELTYIGTINFHVSGTLKKTVRLARNEADFLLFSPLYWDPSLRWQIGLSDQIPIEITLDGGSGSGQFDLHQLKVSALTANLGSGSSNWITPGITQPSIFSLNGGSGSIQLDIPQGAGLTLNIRGGSGSIQVRLPAQPAVRLNIQDEGSGGVQFPKNWASIQPGSKNKDEGVWEAPGYNQASHKVDINILHVGSGSISITTE
jgi:hypothetical protein